MAELDQAKVEAFAGRMLGVLNDGFLAMMASIGHRTGLFDTMAALPPSTARGIARASGLNERYVREWLAAMATGRIVTYDPEADTFHLPPEHAASLTRGAGSANVATITQFLACMGEVEEAIAECFRSGGGLPYSAYTRFHRIMTDVSAQTVEQTLLRHTLPLVPGLLARLRAGIDTLDVGCGSGHAINLMAREFPASRFVGYDFSAEAVDAARREAHAWGLANARFEIQDAATMTDRRAYDFITSFDSIHDQAQPRKVLHGIAEALRDEGVYLMVDIQASSHLADNLNHPLGPYLYSISTLHCMSVSLGLGGEGLGTMWGEQQARALLEEAGFGHVAVHRVEGDILNNLYVARKR
jgi:2-polyprenyl-3-methyl-5-hydroxy-6-metoxy-1,4-benzoquinol methylase